MFTVETDVMFYDHDPYMKTAIMQSSLCSQIIRLILFMHNSGTNFDYRKMRNDKAFAQRIIDLYNYTSGIGIYQELEIDEHDFTPIDLDADKSLQIEN